MKKRHLLLFCICGLILFASIVVLYGYNRNRQNYEYITVVHYEDKHDGHGGKATPLEWTNVYQGYFEKGKVIWRGEKPEIYMDINIDSNGKYYRTIYSSYPQIVTISNDYRCFQLSQDQMEEIPVGESYSVVGEDGEEILVAVDLNFHSYIIRPGTSKVLALNDNLPSGDYRVIAQAQEFGGEEEKESWWLFIIDFSIAN